MHVFLFNGQTPERSSLLLSKIKYHITFHMENCSSSMGKRSAQRQEKTALEVTLLDLNLLVY